nr:MAG TPA_asm: hypothetical protein [Caudoviricetes sp.]
MVHPEVLAIYAFARLRHIDSGECVLELVINKTSGSSHSRLLHLNAFQYR